MESDSNPLRNSESKEPLGRWGIERPGIKIGSTADLLEGVVAKRPSGSQWELQP